MQVRLYESSSTDHVTYDNVKSLVMLDDGTYQIIMEDSEMSQTITRAGTWQNKVIVEKAQASE